jgi:hypothetical protein
MTLYCHNPPYIHAKIVPVLLDEYRDRQLKTVSRPSRGHKMSENIM